MTSSRKVPVLGSLPMCIQFNTGASKLHLWGKWGKISNLRHGLLSHLLEQTIQLIPIELLFNLQCLHLLQECTHPILSPHKSFYSECAQALHPAQQHHSSHMLLDWRGFISSETWEEIHTSLIFMSDFCFGPARPPTTQGCCGLQQLSRDQCFEPICQPQILQLNFLLKRF